jgi:uncharacterized protein (TIGR02145 family)
MKYCPNCGTETKNMQYCSSCGTNLQTEYPQGYQPKNKWIALVLCFCAGGLGFHRFYVGKIGTGIVMLLFTVLFIICIFVVPIIGYETIIAIFPILIVIMVSFGCWPIIDLIRIATGNFTDSNGHKLSKYGYELAKDNTNERGKPRGIYPEENQISNASKFYKITLALAIILLTGILVVIISYSNITRFVPGNVSSDDNSFTDSRDGKKYRTVVVGKQVWMAENLSYNADGSKCYANEPANCQKYGRLYNWYTAMKACPRGWHLPSKPEWEVLTTAVGGEKTEGKYTKAVSGWNNNGNGTDAYGFSALPGGNGYSDGYFVNVGNNGNWWSASESHSNNAYSRNMSYNIDIIYWFNNKNYLFSIRCVQD